MRRIQSIAFLVTLAVLVAGCANPLMDKPAPDFAAKDIAGNEIVLSDLRGKIVLLDFWATWCPPCIDELPNVKRIYDKNKDKDFYVLGISLDSELSQLEVFVEKAQIEWPQIFELGEDGYNISEAYGVEYIPTTFLLDRNGAIRHVGLRDTNLERAVDKLLESG